MNTNLKRLIFLVEKIRPYIAASLTVAGLTGFFPIFSFNQGVSADFRASLAKNVEAFVLETSTIQSNTLTQNLNPQGSEFKVLRELTVIATAYSSSVDETDDTPFITAYGSTTRDGVIANNLLPFGTKIMIPELYGNKIFVVEDRMNSRKGKYQIDIWFHSKEDAKEFGAKTLDIEVIQEI